MDVFEPLEGLFMFNSYVAPIDLSFNQFLLLGPEPLLVHTGTAAQADELAPQLERALGGRRLAYIFISHFESDECGGLSRLLGRFPGAKPLCGAVTARQLAGFGITGDAVVKAPGEKQPGEGLNLQFLPYPSEAHLWEGLLAYEAQRGILFSGDLFTRRGRVGQPLAVSRWAEEVGAITEAQIPSPSARQALQGELARVPVRFVASGHGPVLEVH
ncbi:MAG: hypothetical protein ACM3RP_14070 [Chitinophagales bacterium]